MKKILIVEDDKYLANAHRVKLSKSGFEAMIAYDGEQAIQTLESFSPDLIVLDLIMPNKDGFAVLAELKQNPKWQHIPVIVTSNLSQKEDINRALELGAANYIIKSNSDLNDLLVKIHTILDTQPTT